MINLTDLEKRLGYKFRDRGLLETALTHTSFANEGKRRCESYERLEFLGDAVLEMAVSDYIFHRFSQLPEGDMTRLRAALVCEASFAKEARDLDLGKYIRLGVGEDMSGGRSRDSILADVFEATCAALYLDGGIDAVTRRLYPALDALSLEDAYARAIDNKTLLQELVQSRGGTVEYDLLSETGPDHNKVFTFEVRIDGKKMGKGSGRSKKSAEQVAAEAALKALEK